MATHTVVKGDTLWAISAKYLGKGTRWRELAKLNGINESKPIIYIGQVINLDVTGSTTDKANVSSKPTVEYFGLLAGSTDTLFATWKWDRDNTEKYRVMWYYYVSGVWFVGNDSETKDGTSDYKNSTYSAPDNALKVKFKVLPVSETKKVNDKETTYWTAEWSTAKTYDFSDNPPKTPSNLSVELKDYNLTAELDNLDVDGTHIQFQVVRDNSTVYKTGTAKIVTSHASYSCTVAAGSEYKVRCRAVRGDVYGEWSEYSDNFATKPAASSGITTIKATSETSVYLKWAESKTATSYELEYTTKKSYFDGSDQTTTVSDIETTQYEKTGLETGQEYFFRVRAVNDEGSSAWSGIKSVVIGKTPSAPTTWSSTTTCIVGDTLTLYWTHNAEDGSSQTSADLELYINNVKENHVIDTVDQENDEKTMYYSIDTSGYPEGTKIQWRVRTAGVTKTYGEYSIQRTVDIYAPPTLSISVTDSSGNILETLTSFPFYISGEAEPNTQTPIGYHVSIASSESYETVDQIGNKMFVNAGDEVYSEHYNTVEQLLLVLSAGSVNLENNVEYTVRVVVSMNSGLTAEATSNFSVAWEDDMYEPNAEINIDKDTLTASIRPYCEDEFGVLIEGVTLSIYRREFDGKFTELATGLVNTSNTYITDPHPSLDYARYRVVAVDDTTGAVSYCDIPGYPVGENAIVLQWDETWSNFDSPNEDEFEEPTWSGSLLKLPYNIDVSNDYSPDVSLVEYIGRSHPVSYYGTQVGETATWNVEIEKTDTDTLYGLRRLAVWMGDVYVREPSGSGYWANITISFGQKHLELTIPVTITIARVSGGA